MASHTPPPSYEQSLSTQSLAADTAAQSPTRQSSDELLMQQVMAMSLAQAQTEAQAQAEEARMAQVLQASEEEYEQAARARAEAQAQAEKALQASEEEGRRAQAEAQADEARIAMALKASEEEHRQARAQADAQAQAEAPDGSTIVDTVEVPPHIDLAKLTELKFVHADQGSRTGFWWLVRKFGGNKRWKLRLVMADTKGPTRFVITTKAHLMDVAKLVVREALNDPGGFQLELAQRAHEMVHIFVDNSNIFGGGQEVPDTTQPGGYRLDRSVRVLCRKLHDVVTLERTAAQKVVFGSVPQGTMARLKGGSVFKSWEKEGYKSCVCPRNDDNTEGYAGGSKGSIVDDALIAQMYTAITEYKNMNGWNGRTLVMCTGDGNPNHGDEHSPSFLKVVHEAIDCGWRVEVWAWKKTCSANYLTLARDHAGDPCFSLMYLDESREEITETKRFKAKHTANGSNTTTKTRDFGTLNRSRPVAGGGQRGAAAEEDGHEQGNSTDEEDDDEFTDPLYFHPIVDPVKLAQHPRRHYERTSLVEALRTNPMCPFTQTPAVVTDIVEADDEFKLRLDAYHRRSSRPNHTKATNATNVIVTPNEPDGSYGGGVPDADDDCASVGSIGSARSNSTAGARTSPTNSTSRPKPCVNGAGCKFLKANRCKYFHEHEHRVKSPCPYGARCRHLKANGGKNTCKHFPCHELYKTYTAGGAMAHQQAPHCAMAQIGV
eukprot:CAMPEP_0119481862 /NCGR_PEP_ID=MMETSP1344-20130328/9991_1 /TAXON_ID=236787 /ORGANISM="Florenciella parvula, Strain CCMP2471" /LENGTH=717 /DNA_ID=CAMNT_0007516241 /DNA_START=94 /DNA_END=2243 /DNA_ORIENTATION=+